MPENQGRRCLPSLFDCALMILDDACPPDRRFYRCEMRCEDELDGTCDACWRAYLFFVMNGGQLDFYRADRGVDSRFIR